MTEAQLVSVDRIRLGHPGGRVPSAPRQVQNFEMNFEIKMSGPVVLCSVDIVGGTLTEMYRVGPDGSIQAV